MSEKRPRFSIIVLLVAVAVASYGCGGGSSSNLATGGDFITSVTPDSDSTPGDGENAPAGSTQKTQTAQQSIDYDYRSDKDQLVDFQEEDFPLPWEHGLGAGRIFLLPGKSKEYGNMLVTCPSGDLVCIVLVGSDGSVTYNSLFNTPSFTLIPPGGFPAIPLPRANEAAHAPVLDLGVVLRVGSDAAPRAGELTTGVDRNGVSVSYGGVRDGIESGRVLEFMNQHVRLEDKIAYTGVGDAPGLETYPDPPTIRLAEGTSDLYARFTARAVQVINSALPYEKRITLGTEPLPAGTTLNDVPEGEIFLKFGSIKKINTLGGARLLSNYHDNSDSQRQEVQSANKASVTINEMQMRKAFVYDPDSEEKLKWNIEYPDSRVENSDTIIKFFNDEIFLSVVVHELMHALGFYHIDESRFSDSIMHSKVNAQRDQVNEYSPYLNGGVFFITSIYLADDVTTDDLSDEEATNEPERNIEVRAGEAIPRSNPDKSKRGYLITVKARTVPGNILFPLDRAALLAAYGRRLDPGTQPEELTAENLGSWSDTSFHLRGDVDFQGGRASFGVASSNGLIQPWASGPTPWTNLEDNDNLSGSATWNGALLGITSSSETVAGDASLSVNLVSLDGRLDFIGLEKWEVNEAPGAVGSGAAWGDGDLGYTIQVRGNTFIQTGGDDGQVTGAFFGVAHEAMGGVLERADLSAGFGGKR